MSNIIDQIEKNKFWAMGEKAIKFEPFQARVYTHGNLFSHIIGQVDYDNYGIFHVEIESFSNHQKFFFMMFHNNYHNFNLHWSSFEKKQYYIDNLIIIMN